MNLPPEVQNSLNLTMRDLLQEGRYSELELQLAMHILDGLFMNVALNALANDVDVGRLMGAVMKLVQTIEEQANQDAAKKVGTSGPSGKN